MYLTPGTTLDNPVTKEWKPDLKSGRQEIQEYFQDQGAYDLFDYLLKELLTKQPADPLGHMLECLATEYPTGPLKIIVCSMPGIGRPYLAQRLAEHFGLMYIGAGELLRESGTPTSNLGYAVDGTLAEVVMQRLQQAAERMQGWVLDGFPRTRYQTTFLKERSIVPTHVLVLKASPDWIYKRHQLIVDGDIEGEHVPEDVMELKLRMHTCHSNSALETYKEKIITISAETEEEQVFTDMERAVRTLPRSRGPQPPPRVVILGPRGVGVREHASRLATRLGAVFVDGAKIQAQEKPTKQTKSRQSLMASRSMTSMDLPNLPPLAAGDKLGAVGVRLRQPDCVKQGYVMCGFPASKMLAKILHEDSQLIPIRVITLNASADTCVRRLRHVLTDTATGKVWTSLPKKEEIRKRLYRDPEDQPVAVMKAHSEYTKALPEILNELKLDGEAKCFDIPADGPPEVVFNTAVEFVERPLPLPPRNT